jgi:hypothetical protein
MLEDFLDWVNEQLASYGLAGVLSATVGLLGAAGALSVVFGSVVIVGAVSTSIDGLVSAAEYWLQYFVQ